MRRIAITGDRVHVPLRQTGLARWDGWRHAGECSITVQGGLVSLRGDHGADTVGVNLPWPVTQQVAATVIEGVRRSLENFRARWSAYLDDLPAEEFEARLRGWTPRQDWSDARSSAGGAREAAWRAVAASDEARALATAGRRLFHAFFQRGGDVEGWLARAPRGHRVNLHWSRGSGSVFVPHVPWGLMYLVDLPMPGQPVDLTAFLGLRFRLAYMAYPAPVGSKALGDPEAVHRLHFLYWGTEEGDPISAEARIQRANRNNGGGHVVVPERAGTPDAKGAAVRLLHDPKPDPAVLLYLFCTCRTGGRYGLELGFGRGAHDADTIGHADLGANPLPARPLVFANACATADTDALHANELESTFFDRGCSGYLGTETRVPVTLGGRFADAFFHFFERRAGHAPLPAGEAVAQSRLFLWHEFGNIGGLLYTYVNQYELYLAGEDEVVARPDAGAHG